MALWVLAGLFFLRVLGQVLVAFAGVRFLPPMEDWYSGLLPYPVLLPIQLAILGLQAKIGMDLSRGRGVFVTPRPGLGRLLTWCGYAYFAAMLVRYVVTRTHAIPVFFHWVLAAYLFTLGQYHRRRATAAMGGPP